MKSSKRTPAPFICRIHTKARLMMSVRAVLFGVSLLPIGAVAQSIDGPKLHPSKQASKQIGNHTTKSLERLASYYHAKPNQDARCQGVWIHPSQNHQHQPLVNQLGAKTSTDANHTKDSSHTKDNTYYAQADHGYYHNDDYAILSGNVILEQNGQQILADSITFNPKTGNTAATGQVVFGDIPTNTPNHTTQANHSTKKSMGIIGVAEKLDYNADTQTANAKDVAFASTVIGAHGHADEMTKISDSEYHMDTVMFSTCPPTQRKWHLDADSIDINSDTGRGIAKNSTLKIKNIPVFYLPYFNFPIDDRRSSGFLLPHAGFGSSDGFEVTTPYYVNLAPNFDTTISPTIFTNKNPMLEVEFRYLTEKYGSGTLSGAYLPSDKRYHNKNRHHVSFDHRWHAKNTKNLLAYATYRHVSDGEYLNDFDRLGLNNSPLNLPRRIGINYYHDHLSADLRAETFQALDGTNNDGTPIQDKDRPYSRLPQLAVSYSLPKSTDALGARLHLPSILDHLTVTGIHNTAYFKKSIKDDSETEKSGVRMYNQLSASYPILRSWGYFTPKVSLNHLYASYDEDSLAVQNLSAKEGSYSVFAPQIGLDTAVFFEKSGSPFGWFDKSLGGYQLLSPRLKYTRTSHKDQSDIPNFETAFSATSYDQLLSDSWFLGYDRIQDLHAITPALSYRYIDKDGLTRFDGGVAQQFYLTPLKVGINNSQAYSKRSSGMAWRAGIQPFNTLWIDADGSLFHDNTINHVTAKIRYQPNAQSLYSFSVINRKKNKALVQLPLQAYTAAVIFPINNRWRLLGQAQYDYRNDRLLDALVGVNYEDCCYGFSVYARRHRNTLNPDAPPNNAIMAEVRLNGITSGGRLNHLMKEKVLGYDNIQNAWQHTY